MIRINTWRNYAMTQSQKYLGSKLWNCRQIWVSQIFFQKITPTKTNANDRMLDRLNEYY